MGFDPFLLFWGLGGYGVVARFGCGYGEWGGQQGLGWVDRVGGIGREVGISGWGFGVVDLGWGDF